MSWQKCPICEGTGDNPFVQVGLHTYPCPTCKGVRIISKLTGLPPVIEEKYNIFDPPEPCESDIQNKWICDLIENRHKITPTQNSTQDVSNIQSPEPQV